MMSEEIGARKGQRGGVVANSARKKAPKANASRLPVERLLPKSVIAELRAAVGAVDHITSDLVAEQDRRLEISKRYGLSSRRLGNYLKKLLGAKNGKAGADTRTGPVAFAAGEEWNERIATHRRRQVSVAAILDQTFGRLAKCRPQLWGRRAYLMLVGLVYERLATNEAEISNEELIALAKILAENRRAEAQVEKKIDTENSDDTSRSPEGELPENFGSIVRRIYGTNFQMPVRQPSGNGEVRQATDDGAGS